MSNDGAEWAIIGIVMMLCGAIVCSYIVGSESGERATKAEAEMRGLGAYVVTDNSDGETEWKWFTVKPKEELSADEEERRKAEAQVFVEIVKGLGGKK